MAAQGNVARSVLEDWLQFEAMLAHLSTGFVNFEPSKIDDEISNAQRRVCKFLGVDISALWQLSPDEPGVYRMTHLYRAIEEPPVPDDFDAWKFNPWSLERIHAGEPIWLPSISQAPPEAAIDCETWRFFDIRSVFCFPMTLGGGSAIGAVSFHAVGEECTGPTRSCTG